MNHYFVKFPETKHKKYPYYGYKTIFMFKHKFSRKWDYWMCFTGDNSFPITKMNRISNLGRIFILMRSLLKKHSTFLYETKKRKKC